MKITWEVDDGYVGKTHPQYTYIDNDELEGLSEDEINELINEAIQEDFEQKISWYITEINKNA